MGGAGRGDQVGVGQRPGLAEGGPAWIGLHQCGGGLGGRRHREVDVAPVDPQVVAGRF